MSMERGIALTSACRLAAHGARARAAARQRARAARARRPRARAAVTQRRDQLDGLLDACTRSAPGPSASCINTIAPSSSCASAASSISALASPRQSWVSTVQCTSSSACSAATRSVASVQYAPRRAPAGRTRQPGALERPQGRPRVFRAARHRSARCGECGDGSAARRRGPPRATARASSGVARNTLADHEESGPHPAAIELGEHTRGPLRVRAVVERERAYTFHRLQSRFER